MTPPGRLTGPITARLTSVPMPARRNLKSRPIDHLAAGGTWPLHGLEDGAPDEAKFVMEIARRLQDALGDRSIRSIAKVSGLNPQTIINVLEGRTWAGVPTIYRLEKALQTHLWQRTHVTASRWPTPKPPAT